MKFATLLGVGLTLTILSVVGTEGREITSEPAKEKKIQNDPKDVARAEDKSPGAESINLCGICLVIVERLDKFFVNDTERGIDFLLGQGCSLLPVPLQDECREVSGQLVPILTQLLLEEVIPTKLCKLLTLCSSATAPYQDNEVSKTMAQPGRFKTQEMQFEHSGEEICAVLPFEFNALCHKVMGSTTTLQDVMSNSVEKPRD